MKSFLRQIFWLVMWLPMTLMAQTGLQTASVEPFSVRTLNTYEVLTTPADLANHPYMGQEVTFTAVVSGMALNSGLASTQSPIVPGAPRRLHLFVIDTMATEWGRNGMAMQIVEEIQSPEMLTTLLAARRGAVVRFTGRLSIFQAQVQFDLTAVPEILGSVFEGTVYEQHLSLVEPVYVHSFLINRVDSNTGQRTINLDTYADLAHEYVTLGSVIYIRNSSEGAPRPSWAVDDRMGIVTHVFDTGSRFRNDRGGVYSENLMNHRRLAIEGPYTPPETGSEGVVTGFLSYAEVMDGGLMLPAMSLINPWYDGFVWDGTTRTEPENIPVDVYVYSDPPTETRMIDFHVDMSSLDGTGLFNHTEDVVYIRGSFSDWSSIPMDAVSPGLYHTRLEIAGLAGDAIEYKFYYERPVSAGPTFNGGWESVGGDPNLNRVLVLGPVGVDMSVMAVFNQLSEPPPTDTRLITFTVDMTPLVEPGFFDPNLDDEVYIAGSFSGWGTLAMQRVDPTIWTTTIDMPGMEGDTIQYKFVYTRDSGPTYNYGYEIIDEREITESRYINRLLALGPKDVPVTMDMVPFGYVPMETGPMPVNLAMLNSYPDLMSPADLATHPLMGVDVRFTAIVSGMAMNSGLSMMHPTLTDAPARMHLFVVDTTATEMGRAGMGMQIVEGIDDYEMLVALFNAHRGHILTFTGRLTIHNGLQVQFDLTELPVYVGNALTDMDYAHHLPLLDPMQAGTFLLNERLPDGSHVINLRMYSVFAHQYVILGGRFHRFSESGALRPVWAISGDGDMIGLYDAGSRFRNDREGLYPSYFNHRRPSSEGQFYPPDQAMGTVSGYVSYLANREPDGSAGPNPTTVVSPWYDKVVWLDGNRTELEWIPQDLVLDIPDPGEVRPVVFKVDVRNLMDAGLFDPDMDRVYVRGSFNGWDSTPMDRIETSEFAVTLPISGAPNDTIQYKFYVNRVEGGGYNDGWELLSLEDPYLNRIALLGPADVTQDLGMVSFGYIPIVPPAHIPVYLHTETRFTPGDGEGNWLYVGLGSEEFPAVNLIGMGFRLWFDSTYAVPTAYTTLGVFDDGTDEDLISLFEFTDYGAGASVARTAGTNKLPFGPVIGIRFFVKDQIERFMVSIDEIEIRDAEGNLVPFHLVNSHIDIPTRSMAVWPGDTNADGVVDVFDVEPIAFHFYEYGPARTDRRILWMPIEAPMWDDFVRAHIDANGDGVINQNDLLPVGFNYGKVVDGMLAKSVRTMSRPETTTIPLPAMRAGERVAIPLFVEPTFTGAVDLRSLAFRIEADFSAIDIESAVPAAWFDGSGLLRMVRKEADLDRYAAAFSRTASMGAVSGDGAAVVLTVRAKTDLALDQAMLTIARSAIGVGEERALPAMLYVPDGTITAIEEPGEAAPDRTRLEANFPNPFNPSTVIAWQLAVGGNVRLAVYDVLGREIAVLVDAELPAGSHTATFDATGLSSGLYLYRLETGTLTLTRTMTLVK